MPTDPSKALPCPLCKSIAEFSRPPAEKFQGVVRCSDTICVLHDAHHPHHGMTLDRWNSLPRFTAQDVEDARRQGEEWMRKAVLDLIAEGYVDGLSDKVKVIGLIEVEGK